MSAPRLPGPDRSYFAYDGPGGLPAGQRVKGLPGNKRGPGAMEVFTAHDGQLWVGWNYISDAERGARRSRTATLTITGRGASAKFDVGVRTQISANCQTVPQWVQMLLPLLYNHCQPVVWDPAPTPKKKAWAQPTPTKKGFEQPKPTKKGFEQPKANKKAWEQPTAKSQPQNKSQPQAKPAPGKKRG